MNEFTSAEVLDDEEVTIPVLVHRFLTGKDARTSKFVSLNGTLYNDKSVIARRGSTGIVLLANSNISNTELNDALIGSLYMNKVPFRRIESFATILNPKDRVQELRNGDYENFKAIASLFNFPVTDEDLAIIDKAKIFSKRVEEFFKNAEEEEKNRIKIEEERSRQERVKRQAIEWDSGEHPSKNSSVCGVGGGLRLRLSKDGKRVESSGSYNITIRQARKAWDFASSCWHAKNSDNHIYIGRYGSKNIDIDTRTIKVSLDSLNYGCQKITKREIERFADVMKWPRKEEVKK